MNSKTVRRLISVGLVVLMAVVFSMTSNVFLGAMNITNMLKDAAYLGLIALGMSFVIIGGGIDLSAGGIACLSGILCVRLSVLGAPGIIVVLAGICFGVLCGFVNAIFVTKVKLTEFVATLATGFVFTGLTLVFAFRDNRGTLTSVAVPKGSGLRAFGGNLGGIHYITIVWIILALAAYITLTKTNFGLHTYSVGSHSKSAQMSGVNTNRIKTLGYLICGGFAGLAVVLQVALNGASPLNIGSGYEFQAIAACVVGGVVLGGGKGDSISAFVGSLFLIMLMNGLRKYGLSTTWEYILQGVIILVATSFDAVFNRISIKRLLALSN